MSIALILMVVALVNLAAAAVLLSLHKSGSRPGGAMNFRSLASVNLAVAVVCGVAAVVVYLLGG